MCIGHSAARLHPTTVITFLNGIVCVCVCVSANHLYRTNGLCVCVRACVHVHYMWFASSKTARCCLVLCDKPPSLAEATDSLKFGNMNSTQLMRRMGKVRVSVVYCLNCCFRYGYPERSCITQDM